MKSIITMIAFLVCFSIQNPAQPFILDDNGITVKCENCQPGDTGTVNGILYEAVDRSLLEHRRDEGADLSVLCTSLVTDMSMMFHGMTEFDQDISSWDVSNVTSLWGTFWAAVSFDQDIGAWDVSSAVDMSYMFHNAEQFNRYIGDWDVGNVTEMNCMFSGDSLSLDQMTMEPLYTTFNQDIGNWDVSNVTTMFQMFSYNSAFNQDISNWDVSNVTDMTLMFQKNEAFNQYIGDWDVSNVKRMADMFVGATSFNQNIGSWHIRSVADMDSMFFMATSFNQDISTWDVSDVEEMDYMFYGAASFKKDLSGWCVQNIGSEPEGFATNCPIPAAFYPVWGTCPEMDTTSSDTSSTDTTSTLVYNLSKEQFVLFPNPANSCFTLEFETSIRGVIEIHNLKGQLMDRKPITLRSKIFDTSMYAKGIYFVTVRSDSRVQTEKIAIY